MSMSMTALRALGINYVKYSGICAKALRNSLKPELRTEAMRKGESQIKTTHWENGKPTTNVPEMKAES